MKRALIAAGISLAMHVAVVLAVFSGERAVAPAPVAKATQVEVMRLAGVISPKRAVESAPKPLASVHPERSRGTGEPSVGTSSHAEVARPSTEPVLSPAEGLGMNAGAPPEAAPPTPGGTNEGAAIPAEPVPSDGAPLDTTALSARLQQVALRCYPAAARRFRQTGEAQIRFCLDAAGALRESAVSATSGSDLLDRAATDCVVPGAAPFGPETFGRCFTVPVRFRL